MYFQAKMVLIDFDYELKSTINYELLKNSQIPS